LETGQQDAILPHKVKGSTGQVIDLPHDSGLTLLEVVIAVSLLSLLMVGVMTSLRLGLSALGRTNTQLMANRRVAGAQRVLEGQLEGFMPVIGLYGGTPGAPPNAKMPFFQGEPQSMRFVSSYSLQESARGLPRILEFQVIPGKDNEGVRLVVNENLYTGPASAGFFCLGKTPEGFLFRPIEIGSRSFVLADRLAFCRFTYQDAPPPPAPVKWTPVWVLPRWPGAIRIEMAPLDEGGPRLQPVSVTARIHVTRYPIFEYGDY
jgi:prepilin-type N-terminal cleavage/methylation domain-containing protein